MPLSHIEHCLVVADDMDQTRDWYCTVLGMKEKWRKMGEKWGQSNFF